MYSVVKGQKLASFSTIRAILFEGAFLWRENYFFSPLYTKIDSKSSNLLLEALGVKINDEVLVKFENRPASNSDSYDKRNLGDGLSNEFYGENNCEQNHSYCYLLLMRDESTTS